MDWRRAWRITGLVVLALGLEAGATGVYLYFRYRPTAAQAWDDIAALHSSVSLGLRVRSLHRTVSRLLVPASIALAAFGVGAARSEGRLGALSVGPAVAALAASFTGFLLPWDQLALYAVTVGTDLRGFAPVFGPQVRFVLRGGSEVSTSTVQRWLVVHVVAGASLVIGAIAPLLPVRPPTAQEPAPSALVDA